MDDIQNVTFHKGSASSFYEHIGFGASALDPLSLMITLADLKASLGQEQT